MPTPDSTTRDLEQILYSDVPVLDVPMRRPVIVVGLPRSGSSLLSDVLSQSSDYFVFDDLYIRRAAMSVGAKGPLSAAQLEHLVRFLGWQVRARIKHGVFEHTKTNLTWDVVDGMDEALRRTFAAREVTWHQLVAEWLGRLTLAQGRRRWGFKAPQDFMHMDEYARLFPDVRFVFLHRNPHTVLASLKHVRAQDGDRRLYHPVVYARYWRMASELARDAAERHPVLDVGFEELTKQPAEVGSRLAEFLDTSFGTIDMSRTNTSFGGSTARPGVSSTESWLCDKVAGPEMPRRGYEPSGLPPRLRDVPDLVATSARFMRYQVARASKDKAALDSIRNFVMRLGRSGR